jgi:uncharacterized OB-fold protein
MKSYTEATMLLGKGSVYSFPQKQCINTKSSTKAELVSVDDRMPLVIWTHNFFDVQGFEVCNYIIFRTIRVPSC